MIGKCLVKHWSKTQTTVSLSSSESELHGIAQGCAQALEIQALMNDLGWNLPIVVHGDATAAIGMARRKGLSNTSSRLHGLVDPGINPWQKYWP